MVAQSSWLRMAPKSPIARGGRSPYMTGGSSRTMGYPLEISLQRPPSRVAGNESPGELANRHASSSREQVAQRPDRARDRRGGRGSGLHVIGGSGRTGGCFGKDPY